MQKVDKDKNNKSYKILNINGNKLYVLGIKSILKFSEEYIALKLKNAEILCIFGENFIICECDKNAIMILGKILKLEVQQGA